MALEIRTATTIREFTQEEWERLSRGQPFSSYSWYQFGESVLADSPCTYITAYRSGEPVGRAAFWLSRQEPLPLPFAPLRLAASTFLRHRPLFICRSPLADWSGLVLLDMAGREEALGAIAETAQAAARQQKASFVTFDYLNAKESGENWHNVGFSTLTIADPGTRLALPGTDFAGYIKGLPKSAQKDFRRHTNQAQGRGITVSAHAQVSDPQRALELVNKVEKRHKSMPKPWARRLLSLANPPHATWLAARSKGELVGCGLVLNDGQVQVATLLGINYQVQYVYFQLMYAAIRNAVEQKAGVLRAGSGAYPFKQHLGFTLEDNNYVAYSGCGPAFQPLGKWLGRLGAA